MYEDGEKRKKTKQQIASAVLKKRVKDPLLNIQPLYVSKQY